MTSKGIDKLTRLRREIRRLSVSRERATARIHELEESVMAVTQALKKYATEQEQPLITAAETLALLEKDQWNLMPVRAGHIKKTFIRMGLDVAQFDERHYQVIAKTLNEVRKEDAE